MRVERNYQPKEVNWLLLPDLLERVTSAIPDSEKKEGQRGDPLHPASVFRMSTFSQDLVIQDPQDFVDFVKNTTEPPATVDIVIECQRHPASTSPYPINPPYFRLAWSDKRIRIVLARTMTKSALAVLEEIEGKLQLEPAKPPQKSDVEEERHLRRTVFVAHAFDDVGRSYAFQLTKLLNLLHFQVVSGEGFSPESVSSKVKRRLNAQEIVVAVLSRNEDLTWLTQEMTAADVAGKPLFLLVQDDVEFKAGILGDIEYVRFPKGQFSETFASILEGLREIGFLLG